MRFLIYPYNYFTYLYDFDRTEIHAHSTVTCQKRWLFLLQLDFNVLVGIVLPHNDSRLLIKVRKLRFVNDVCGDHLLNFEPLGRGHALIPPLFLAGVVDVWHMLHKGHGRGSVRISGLHLIVVNLSTHQCLCLRRIQILPSFLIDILIM